MSDALRTDWEDGQVVHGSDINAMNAATNANSDGIATQAANIMSLQGQSELVSIGDQGFGTSLPSYATSAAGTSEVMFVVGETATGISAVWDHWYTNGYNDTDPAGSIVFSASIRVVSSSNPNAVVGTLYRFTFNGRTAVTLDPGGRIVADVLGLSLLPGDMVAVRTFLSSGTAYAPQRIRGTFTGFGGFTTGDLTAPGSATIADSGGFFYAPSALLGYCASGSSAKSVLLLGTSIAAGQVDDGVEFTIPVLGNGGFALRALSGWSGLINAAVPGDEALQFVKTDGSQRRLSLAPWCTSAIVEYGTNDYVTGAPTGVVQPALLDIAQRVRRMGISKVFLTTVLPRNTSTDGWATTVNQTPLSMEPQRVAHNTWVRAGCPIDPDALTPVAVGTLGALTAGSFGHPITGFFDTASRVETSLNSGFWLPAQRVATGSMTAGSLVLTSSTANFQSANQEDGGDLGTDCILRGAGTSGSDLSGAITIFNNSTTVNFNVAGTTVNNAQLNIGVMTTSGVHPSSRGHRLMAQAIDVDQL